MPTDSMQPPRKTPIGLMIAVVLIVAALVLGYVIGVSVGQKSGYAAGLAAANVAPTAAQQQVGPGGAPVPAASLEAIAEAAARSLSGTVAEVLTDGFVMSVPVSPSEENPDPVALQRTVRLAPDAKITLVTQKSATQFAEEAAAFRTSSAVSAESAPDASENPAEGSTQQPQIAPAPSPFTTTTLSLADIKPGMTATVTSSTPLQRDGDVLAAEVTVRADVRPQNVTPEEADTAATDAAAAETEDGTAP